MRLIYRIILPLATLLVLNHFTEVLLHGLGQLAVRVQRRVVAAVHLCVLVVNVHAAPARKITVANDKTLK